MQTVSNNFQSRACGKLLLSGEYFVLKGATSLALPTRLGQTLSVTPLSENKIIWTSFLCNSEIWFTCEFDYLKNFEPNLQIPEAALVSTILKKSVELNPALQFHAGYQVSLHLEFDRTWGLGSSSTLISLLSKWLHVDPYLLLENTFGGSGYDIAVAEQNHAILYSTHVMRSVKRIDFVSPFLDSLYFFHLNRKQNSREAIAYFNQQTTSLNILERISEISNLLSCCSQLESFKELLSEHEQIVSSSLHLPKVSDILTNIPKEIQLKSLGAWGGDFVLAATQMSESEVREILNREGIHTLVTYKEMILN